MGNLPNSRTITLSDGDPIPSNLVNEIQDCIVNNSQQERVSSMWPTVIGGSSLIVEATNPISGSAFPCKKFTSLGTVKLGIPFKRGVTVSGFSMMLYGNGDPTDVGDIDIELRWLASMNTGSSISLGTLHVDSAPASWVNRTITAFSPLTLGGGALMAMVTANVDVYFGFVEPKFSR